MLNVNDVRKSVLKLGSLTAAVSTGSVYDGSHNRYARKRELNIVVTATGDDKYMIRQVPLFDDADLAMLRLDTATNKFLHIGCVTMSIEPLIHNQFLNTYGQDLRGYCLLVDSTFEDLGESVISAHKYELHNGRADYVCFPNHCLSLTDPNIQERLSILVGFDNIKVKPGTELFNLCIGYIITGVNTLNPTGQRGLKSFPINGSADVAISSLIKDEGHNLKESYNNVDLISKPSDDDIYLKSKGSFLSNVLGTTKTIKRRTMRVKIPESKADSSHSGKLKENESKQLEPHRRSVSLDMDERTAYELLNKRMILGKAQRSLSFRRQTE